MDKTKHSNIQNDDNIISELTHDDADMLQQVLQRVRGSYPDSPFRQADYLEELEPEV